VGDSSNSAFGLNMTSAITVANKILELANAKDLKLTPLQLMKLVYMSQGWSLALRDAPLYGERIEAWQYGPVVPVLYNRTKTYGSAPITGPLPPAPNAVGEVLSGEEIDLLRSVVDNYAHLSGPALSNLTHRPGSPWSKVWVPGQYNVEIPVGVIRSHYNDLKSSKTVTAA